MLRQPCECCGFAGCDLCGEWKTLEESFPPEVVKLTEAQRDEAWAYGEKTESQVNHFRSYTGLEEPGRYFVGRLGELAFRDWCDERRVQYEELVRSDGKSDVTDFRVWRAADSKPFLLNVKNTVHPNARMMMRPIAQEERHPHDLLVGAKSVDDKSTVRTTFFGAIGKKRWELQRRAVEPPELGVKVPTYVLLLKDLPIPMAWLAHLLLRC